MYRRNLRALIPGLALCSLLVLAACDSEGDSPTELDSAMLEQLDPDFHRTGDDKSSRGRLVDVADVRDYPEGVEKFGRSWLTRKPGGVTFRLLTRGLEPGHAYTLWMVIFNNPEGCKEDDGAAVCNDFDLFNPASEPDMVWAAGTRVRRSGRAIFRGYRPVGTTAASVNEPLGLPSNGLTNPAGADIRFIVHDHGRVLREYMPDMIKSIDGGCKDAGVPEEGFPSPWNLYDGPVSLPGFGRRGPNTCQSVQAAAHIPG